MAHSRNRQSRFAFLKVILPQSGLRHSGELGTDLEFQINALAPAAVGLVRYPLLGAEFGIDDACEVEVHELLRLVAVGAKMAAFVGVDEMVG